MSLPMPWVNKIFSKLTVVYGRDFINRWEGLDIEEVKADWASELSGFFGQPEAISYALQNLPDGKPPTVLEFRAICRKSPRIEPLQIQGEIAKPEVVQAELTKVNNLRVNSKQDPLAWAKRHIAKHEVGGKVRPISLLFARQALGLRGQNDTH